MSLSSRPALLLVSLAALMAVVAFFASQRVSVSATGTSSMVLEVGGMASSCDDFNNPTKCTVEQGEIFTLGARVESLPEGASGYAGWQALIYYGELQYNPRENGAEDITWPDSGLPLRSPADPVGDEGTVGYGDVTSPIPPLPASTYIGNLLQIRLECPDVAQSFLIALIGRDAAELPLGSGFLLTEADGGHVVPAKVVGQETLDLDMNPLTDAVTVDVNDTVQINCGGPTPTPPPPGPDLSLQSLRVELETGGDCTFTSTNLGVRIVVENKGPLDAGKFSVDVNGDGVMRVDGGLEAGDTVSLWFPGYNNGENTVEIDVLDEVVEQDEQNNNVTVVPAIPTLPPTCTPSPTPTLTPTPVGLNGDVDCNQQVTAIDAALLLQLIAALTDTLPCENLADVNGNGTVDAIDVSLILQFTAGLLPSL